MGGVRVKDFLRVFEATITTSSSPAYTANDAVGGLVTINNFVLSADQAARLESVILIDKGAQKAQTDLFFYRSAVTGGTDNAAYAPSDADAAECIGYVAIAAADYKDHGTSNAVATKALVGLSFALPSKSIYVQAVTRGTPTYTGTSDLVLKLVVGQV